MSTPNTPQPMPLTQRPLPIQNFQLTPDDFKNPGRLNTMMQQVITAVQALQGTGGRTVLPSGVDVQGDTVSGLGAPKSQTDAISQGHAESSYSAPVVGPQLDIGGKHALKGLTLVQMQANQNATDVATILAKLAAGASGTITLAKLTGGGSNGSITVTGGIITAFVNPT